jgi:hypothetical protein
MQSCSHNIGLNPCNIQPKKQNNFRLLASCTTRHPKLCWIYRFERLSIMRTVDTVVSDRTSAGKLPRLQRNHRWTRTSRHTVDTRLGCEFRAYRYTRPSDDRRITAYGKRSLYCYKLFTIQTFSKIWRLGLVSDWRSSVCTPYGTFCIQIYGLEFCTCTVVRSQMIYVHLHFVLLFIADFVERNGRVTERI